MLEEINNFAGKQKHVLEHRCHTTLYRLTWSATQDIHNILNTCDVDVVDLTNVFHKLAQNSTSYLQPKLADVSKSHFSIYLSFPPQSSPALPIHIKVKCYFLLEKEYYFVIVQKTFLEKLLKDFSPIFILLNLAIVFWGSWC